MNDGILTSGYAPPPMPSPLLGVPTSAEMIDAYGYDADALRYIRAVEAADKARLELGVRLAVNAFVVGCKADGIWQAIRASCILIGARTLSGILVPLTGISPTNFNFVSGDYVRRTGLVGNASTKYLNTNRLPLEDGLNSYHMAVWMSSAASGASLYAGNSSLAAGATNLLYTEPRTIRECEAALRWQLQDRRSRILVFLVPRDLRTTSTRRVFGRVTH